MPSPLPPCPVPNPARAPFRVLANEGEAAGRLGAVREDCPYGDADARSVPWLDGWWQGRRARERAARRPERPGGVSEGKGRPCRRCRLPGCAEPVAWDPARTARQNALVDYCCKKHKAQAFYRVRTARARAAAEAARDERHGGQETVTKRKGQVAPPGPRVCKGCGGSVPAGVSGSTRKNIPTDYCSVECKEEAYRLRRKERAARERAEILAGTRPARARRPGPTSARDVPDRCEAEAARLNAYWAALGYDVGAEVVVDDAIVEPDGRRRRVRRVRSRLVCGVPKGATWDEVKARMKALEKTG